MLAGVSHDLKTPLTRMKLALGADAAGAGCTIAGGPMWSRWSICSTTIWLSRAARGGEESAPADLAELVRDAAAAGARARQAPDVRVTAPDVFPVSVKRAALRRCLSNLIDNAIKHGRHVAVTLRRDERWVEIVVEDDGPGIAEARREEAFRPFHRLDEGRNLQSGGSGLGLAIARDIARAHGGDIVLGDSRLGGLAATIRNSGLGRSYNPKPQPRCHGPLYVGHPGPWNAGLPETRALPWMARASRAMTSYCFDDRRLQT